MTSTGNPIQVSPYLTTRTAVFSTTTVSVTAMVSGNVQAPRLSTPVVPPLQGAATNVTSTETRCPVGHTLVWRKATGVTTVSATAPEAGTARQRPSTPASRPSLCRASVETATSWAAVTRAGPPLTASGAVSNTSVSVTVTARWNVRWSRHRVCVRHTVTTFRSSKSSPSPAYPPSTAPPVR